MIENIINKFEEASSQHLLINSFRYGEESLETSVNSDTFPQVLLEAPIISNIDTTTSNVMNYDISFDVSFVEDDKWLKGSYQNTAFYISQQILLKLEQELLKPYNLKINNLSFLTFENESINRLCGIRVSCTLQMDNPFYHCMNNTHFNVDKILEIPSLGDIDTITNEQGNCEIFSENYKW